MSINRRRGALVCVMCAAGLTAGLARAEEASVVPKAGTATELTTRSEAQTELFELLATSNNGQLTVFLDRFASNEPVNGAKVEVESGAWKAFALPAGDGTYRVSAPQLAKPGHHPLQFTVQAGADADLIETTLVVAEAATLGAAAPGAGWIARVGAALAGMAALLSLALLLKRWRLGRSGATPQPGNKK